MNDKHEKLVLKILNEKDENGNYLIFTHGAIKSYLFGIEDFWNNNKFKIQPMVTEKDMQITNKSAYVLSLLLNMVEKNKIKQFNAKDKRRYFQLTKDTGIEINESGNLL